MIQTDTSCFECITCLCNSMSTLAESVFDLTPYFYPFSIEFSILVGKAIETHTINLWEEVY